MCLTTFAAAAIALSFSVPAMAQQWVEFRSEAWGFAINFPHEPRSEKIEYTDHYDQKVPARVFSAERATGRYTMTAVSFAGSPTDSLTAVAFAAEAIRAKGTPTYYAFHDLDGIPGLVLSVTQTDGRRIQAGVYFLDQRLYIAEGSVAAGNPAPSHFQQSVNFFGPEGDRTVLDDTYDAPN